MADKKPKKQVRFDDEEIEQAGEAARESAIEAARKLLKGKTRSRASMSDVADDCMSSFRGSQGLAARLRIEYEFAPRGSAQRARILQIVFDLIKENKRNNLEVKSTDMMTDEEIDAEIMAIVSGANQKDVGSPKTAKGRNLLEAALLGDGAEYAELEHEMLELDENHELDKLAAELSERERADNADVEFPSDDDGDGDLVE